MKHPDMRQPKRGRKDGDQSADPGFKPFDVWLARGLHQIYDDVANEPIPDDLLKLIEDDRQSGGGGTVVDGRDNSTEGDTDK